MIGRTSLDYYQLKIERPLRHSQHQKEVLNSPKGVFLYPSLETLISFPKFEQDCKPYLWKPKPKPQPQKKQGFFSRLWEFTSKPQTNHRGDEEEDEDEIGVTFEDENLIEEELF